MLPLAENFGLSEDRKGSLRGRGSVYFKRVKVYNLRNN